MGERLEIVLRVSPAEAIHRLAAAVAPPGVPEAPPRAFVGQVHGPDFVLRWRAAATIGPVLAGSVEPEAGGGSRLVATFTPARSGLRRALLALAGRRVDEADRQAMIDALLSVFADVRVVPIARGRA